MLLGYQPVVFSGALALVHLFGCSTEIGAAVGHISPILSFWGCVARGNASKFYNYKWPYGNWIVA